MSDEEIIYFDAAGKEVGREKRKSNAQRISMRAAATERQMAAYKMAHPEVVRAHYAGCRFSFTADGKSWFEDYLED